MPEARVVTDVLFSEYTSPGFPDPTENRAVELGDR